MKAIYWIEKEHRYIDYDLPEGSSLIESNMDKTVSCACCGKKIKFGQSFTSRRIHSEMGFGYAVCEECYYSGEERR